MTLRDPNIEPYDQEVLTNIPNIPKHIITIALCTDSEDFSTVQDRR